MDLLSREPLKIGVNYWPAGSAIQMWSQWDPKEIAADFQQMSTAGIQLVRFFLFTPDFVRGGEVHATSLKRYRHVLSLLADADIHGLPTLFVGHMSGQNYRVEGWDEKTYFTDPEVLAQQRGYVRQIVDASLDCKHLAGWCLTNEIPNDFPGDEPARITSWVRMITTTIRELDSRPIVLGDGVWSPEVTGAGGRNNLEPSQHYLLRELAPLQDTLGVHFYPRYDDYWPQAYTCGFRLLMAGSWKENVFLEEFGHSIAMGSEENQALYYREVLFSAMQTGASAVLNWCWTDFDKPDLRPYLHNPFEMRFGLRRSDGSFRPALQEMQEFARLSKDLTDEGWEPAKEDSWLPVPATFYHPLPFDWDGDTDTRYKLYLHTYGALASAGAAPVCIHEPAVDYLSQVHENHFTHAASFLHAPATLWLPAMKRLSAPFWKECLDHVHRGGTIYASFAADHWMIDLDETLGIQSDLRFGLPDFYPDDIMTISSPSAWGAFDEEPISIHLGEWRERRALAYLPARCSSAEILLQDNSGRPLLIRKKHGSGVIYFSLFPFEMLMTQSSDENVRTIMTMLYASIREAQLPSGSSCVTPGGEFMRFQRGQGTREFLFNHSWEPRTFKIRSKKPNEETKNIRVELPPKCFCEIDTREYSNGEKNNVNAVGIEN